MKFITIAILFGLMSTQAFSKDIFLISKNIRPQNILHYDVKVEKCSIMNKSLSSFWIMGESKGQQEQMKPEEVAKFSPVILRESDEELEFTLPVFNQINHPIANNPILVKLVNCEPKAFIKIEGQNIQLLEIHANISIIKMGVSFLLIKGKKSNGAQFTYKIDA